MNYLIDFLANLCWIAFQVLCPFSGNPIELIFGIFQRDMRIQT
jgi:hypothetical protein